MKTTRSAPRHCNAAHDSDGTRRAMCGVVLTVAHLHADRATFERLAARSQCPGCAAALAAYKAQILAENATL